MKIMIFSGITFLFFCNCETKQSKLKGQELYIGENNVYLYAGIPKKSPPIIELVFNEKVKILELQGKEYVKISARNNLIGIVEARVLLEKEKITDEYIDIIREKERNNSEACRLLKKIEGPWQAKERSIDICIRGFIYNGTEYPLGDAKIKDDSYILSIVDPMEPFTIVIKEKSNNILVKGPDGEHLFSRLQVIKVSDLPVDLHAIWKNKDYNPKNWPHSTTLEQISICGNRAKLKYTSLGIDWRETTDEIYWRSGKLFDASIYFRFQKYENKWLVVNYKEKNGLYWSWHGGRVQREECP